MTYKSALDLINALNSKTPEEQLQDEKNAQVIAEWQQAYELQKQAEEEQLKKAIQAQNNHPNPIGEHENAGLALFKSTASTMGHMATGVTNASMRLTAATDAGINRLTGLFDEEKARGREALAKKHRLKALEQEKQQLVQKFNSAFDAGFVDSKLEARLKDLEAGIPQAEVGFTPADQKALEHKDLPKIGRAS